jgi:hypothetical protein
MSTTIANKTLTLRYIKTSDLHAPLSFSIWRYPGAPVREGYTIIPHDTAPMRRLDMGAQADILDNYKHVPHDADYAADVKVYKTHDFYAEFEYVVRDGEFPIENKRARDGPDKAPLRVRFWRLISGPPIDSFYYDISITSRNNEYNHGCAILKQLNEGLSELHRGRTIMDPCGKKLISQSSMLRRSPTIRDSPANYGNPLILNEDGEITEVEYERVYEYYYGMYGSPECGKRERDDQDAVATFPTDDAEVSESERVFSRPSTPTGV